jgi:hypothetical protein
MARCIIVGVPPSSDISGYPADLNQKVIDELLNISVEGHCIALSYLVKPIPNVEAMKMLDEALFHNRVSQDSFRDKSSAGHQNKTKQPPLKKVFEESEFTQNYKELFDNKQKMFHTAFIVVLWGILFLSSMGGLFLDRTVQLSHGSVAAHKESQLKD